MPHHQYLKFVRVPIGTFASGKRRRGSPRKVHLRVHARDHLPIRHRQALEKGRLHANLCLREMFAPDLNRFAKQVNIPRATKLLKDSEDLTILPLSFQLRDRIILLKNGEFTTPVLAGGGRIATRIGTSPGLVGGGTEINIGVVGGGTTEKNALEVHFAEELYIISDAPSWLCLFRHASPLMCHQMI